MTTLEAIAVLRDRTSEDLSHERLAALREFVDGHPEVAELVGGRDVVEQFFAAAETAEPNSKPSEPPVSDSQRAQPSRHSNAIVEVVVLLLVVAGAAALAHRMMFGEGETPWQRLANVLPTSEEPIDQGDEEVEEDDVEDVENTEAATADPVVSKDGVNAGPADAEPRDEEGISTEPAPEPIKAPSTTEPPPPAETGPRWRAWNIDASAGARVSEEFAWSISEAGKPSAAKRLVTGGEQVTLSGQWRVDAEHARLTLDVVAAEGEKAGAVEVRAGGEVVDQFNVPKESEPRDVSLLPLLNKEIDVEVVYTPGDQAESIEWRAAKIGPLAAESQTDERYWAHWRDGTISKKKDELQDWFGVKGSGRFGGRNLFDRKRPVRVVRDTTQSAVLEPPYVELANGDMLPGRVAGVTTSSEYGSDGPWVVVAYRVQPEIRVRLESIRRVVWAGDGGGRHHPGRVVRRNGETIQAKAVHWNEQEIAAETGKGVVSIDYLDLAEVHLPVADPFAALADDIVQPHTEPGDLIVRVRTTDGGIFTSRRSMIRYVGLKVQRRTEKQRAAIQPAWAFDPVYLDTDHIVAASFREENELPLSVLPSVEARQSADANSLPWRRDRNVLGLPLVSGDVYAESGVGMHSRAVAAFRLPTWAVEFTGRVGIDRLAEASGCAQCRVLLDSPDGKPAWESGYLRGGQPPVEITPISLVGREKLILVADLGHEGRPDGAAPEEQGDLVDWLSPMVRIDVEKLDRPIRQFARWMPALAGWSLAETFEQPFELRPYWHLKDNRWVTTIVPVTSKNTSDKDSLQFTRRLDVGYENAWLPVAAGRSDRGGSHKVFVTVDDGSAPSTMNGHIRTEQATKKSDVRYWQLGQYLGKQVEAAIVIEPRSGKGYNYAGVWFDAARPQPVITNLTGGQPIRPDVPLTSLTPLSATADGKPLELQPGHCTTGTKLVLRDIPFDDGYGVPHASELTYALEPDYRRFVAVLGLADGWKGVGPYEILLDDEPHWQSTNPPDFKRNTPAAQIDVNLPPGHKTITLRLTGESSEGAWANAGFMR